jgi:phage repressor protein C with HTH and peptisase S24 domain
MRHSDVWRALDALAARHGLTPSGLARLAGLDPTAFNPSKRLAAEGGRARWPSTESLAKALEAVGETFETFAALMGGREAGRAVPLIGFAQAGAEGFFDDAGFPVGSGWDEVRFPGLGDEAVYALEIQGTSMEPVYREGDRIIVAPAASLRRGDRVVAKTREGEVMAKVLGLRTERKVELLSFNPAFAPREIAVADLAWLARIVWASQ